MKLHSDTHKALVAIKEQEEKIIVKNPKHGSKSKIKKNKPDSPAYSNNLSNSEQY